MAPALAAIWAIGWTVTTVGGIQVEDQFTVFGSFGAITVTAITAVLPVIVSRRSVNPRSVNHRSVNQAEKSAS